MAAGAHSLLFAVLLACVAVDAPAQEIQKELDDEARATVADQPPAKKTLAPRRGGKVDVNEADRRLKQARLERTLGAEPRPGELTRDAGAPKPNNRYWQRQEKLRIAVERALRRSNQMQKIQVASR